MAARSLSRSIRWPANGPPFPPVWCLLVYYLILSCGKEPGWGITAGFAGANVRTSNSPAKVTKSMCASVARPCRRASARPLRTRTTSSRSLRNRTFPKRTWPTLNGWRSRTIRKLPASPKTSPPWCPHVADSAGVKFPGFVAYKQMILGTSPVAALIACRNGLMLSTSRGLLMELPPELEAVEGRKSSAIGLDSGRVFTMPR